MKHPPPIMLSSPSLCTSYPDHVVIAVVVYGPCPCRSFPSTWPSASDHVVIAVVVCRIALCRCQHGLAGMVDRAGLVGLAFVVGMCGLGMGSHPHRTRARTASHDRSVDQRMGITSTAYNATDHTMLTKEDDLGNGRWQPKMTQAKEYDKR